MVTRSGLKINYNYRLKISSDLELVNLFFNTPFGRENYAGGFIAHKLEKVRPGKLCEWTGSRCLFDMQARLEEFRVMDAKATFAAESPFATPDQLELLKKDARKRTALEIDTSITITVFKQMSEAIKKYGAIYLAEEGAYFPHSEDIIIHKQKKSKELKWDF
jgi:hypothetical protein